MLNSNSKSKILFLMTGSIACYKACGLVSMLVKNGYDVKVAASQSALKFIGEATLEGLTGKSVSRDLWDRGSTMEHIQLERWADLIVVAPASAHFINRIAHGIGDDLLTTLFLAHQFSKPFLVAPAMNTAMYLNPVTQNSIRILKQMGIRILESASGVLACGETGYGKLLEPDLLFQEIQKNLNKLPQTIGASSTTLEFPISKPKCVLVTAGGTREPIDDVRSISNKSSGTTGEKIASSLAELGYDVTLLLAKSATVKARDFYKTVTFDTFSDLSQLLQNELSEKSFDAVIHAAAVSDFTVEKAPGKISSKNDLTLCLKKNPKLVNQIKSWSRNKVVKVVAFKLTSDSSDEQILSKVQSLMEEANADIVVQNDTRVWTNRDQHEFQLFFKEKRERVVGVQDLVSHFLKEGVL